MGAPVRRMRYRLIRTIAVLGLLRFHPVSVRGWSPRIDARREFLQTCATSAARGAAAASSIAVAPGAARAEGGTASRSKIYAPPAGSLAGQVHVVTGASAGLGLESVRRLAAAGATVVGTARTAEKGATALRSVRDSLLGSVIDPSGVRFATLDLDDLGSVADFPERCAKVLGGPRKINVLLNNAGVGFVPQRELTRDGFERTFQSNHLGPFALTAALFPYLDRAVELGSSTCPP